MPLPLIVLGAACFGTVYAGGYLGAASKPPSKRRRSPSETAKNITVTSAGLTAASIAVGPHVAAAAGLKGAAAVKGAAAAKAAGASTGFL